MTIVAHYENCLERHGDSHLGVDWPKPQDVEKRYRVMLDVIHAPLVDPAILLDMGCGAAHLYDYLLRNPVANLIYRGHDISPKFIELCRQKYPEIPFTCGDALEPGQELPACDYAVMNGVFTEKRELNHEEMLGYFQVLLTKVFAAATVGVAFNVMSKQVDWERADLFHLSLDELAWFLTRNLSRNFIIRNDYGLYEYTTYLYK
jgi:hypothetical protein